MHDIQFVEKHVTVNTCDKYNAMQSREMRKILIENNRFWKMRIFIDVCRIFNEIDGCFEIHILNLYVNVILEFLIYLNAFEWKT